MEITDTDPACFEQNDFSVAFSVAMMGLGHVWLYSRTTDSVLVAGQYIAALEPSQGLKMLRSESVFRQKRSDAAPLDRLAAPLSKNGYGLHLKRIQKETVY